MHNPFRSIHLTYNMRERVKRASAQNHVFSFLGKVRLSQVIYTLSASRPAYYSWSKIHLQANVYAKLSLLATVKLIIWNLEMHVQHDLSLTVIALTVSYFIGYFVIICKFNASCFLYYTYRSDINNKQPTKHEHRENLKSVRASVEIFAFVRSKTPISFNVWIGT